MSTNNRQFSLVLESSLKLKADESTPHSKPIPAPPTLESVLAEIGPLPREALFLGVASDGLPVLLNLHDPSPGSLFIVGEAGSGKTAVLKSIVNAISQTHPASDLQFGVITDHVDEWGDVGNMSHCMAMFSASQNRVQDFLHSLSSWAHDHKNSSRSILLLVDDLEAVARLDVEALQNFRWLLARGPSRHVWPMVTMNAERYGQVLAWIPIFRTRIFGRIRNERVANALGGDKVSALNTLEAGIQFSLRENGNWVRFWLPSF